MSKRMPKIQRGKLPGAMTKANDAVAIKRVDMQTRGAPHSIGEDPKQEGATNGAYQCQECDECRCLHEIRFMRHVGKVVFNEGHKERQSHHHSETCQENESEVVFTPGGDPIRDKPAAKAKECTLFLSRRFACNWTQGDL